MTLNQVLGVLGLVAAGVASAGVALGLPPAAIAAAGLISAVCAKILPGHGANAPAPGAPKTAPTPSDEPPMGNP